MKSRKHNAKFKSAILILLVLLAFISGFMVNRFLADYKQQTAVEKTDDQMWTCSMHPQIQETKPGLCRICGMELIPVETGDESQQDKPRQISFSPEAVKLMQLQTEHVKRRFVDAKIRMVGKVQYDETKLKKVTAWTAGRIERLFVDFVGTEVIKDDHMVKLYSPELISAQAEYLQAIKSVRQMSENTSKLIKQSNDATLKAAEDKLILLGLNRRQLSEIQAKGQPLDYLTVYAPVSGIVIEKHVKEGEYVETGTIIYTIADLSHLWVKLDAYESDVALVRYRQEVEFTTPSCPGEIFKGKITFIPPTLNTETRTVKLRVNVDNTRGRLKPGMFVRAVVHSKLAQDGVVTDPNLADKYICPMHPSVLKDKQGICDICEMKLVKASSKGIATTAQNPKPPLVIPASAPLITGKRAVVYVEVADNPRPTYQGREILLGPRADEYYIVKEGLVEGEKVVIKGNFKIDSALQIQAKPSMMNPPEDNNQLHQKKHQDADKDEKKQTRCPVMGGAVNKKYFIEYKGKKVYFCCPGCDKAFLKNPEKYLDKLPQFK